MKKRPISLYRLLVCIALSLMVLVSVWACSTESVTSGDGEPGDGVGKKRLTILHMNDIHSHLLGFPNADYTPFTIEDDDTIGGIARVATKVNEIRGARALSAIPVLLLDAGDFTMGTLFHLLEGAAEFGIMNHLGFDALTLGNHEFDWLPSGTATIASHAGDLPVEATNMDITDPLDPGAQALQDLIDQGKILPHTVLTLMGSLKVGLFGLMGEDADGVIFKPDPDIYPLTFRDRIEAANETVSYLREEEGVDIVICVSHSGVDSSDHTQGEDPELAAAVPGIDVIISGHTHTYMPDPVMIGSTIIVQAHCYAQHLGILDLERTGDVWGVSSYEYVKIDDSIPGDAATQALVEGYIDDVDVVLEEILGEDGPGFRDAIAETGFDLKKTYGQEHTLGNLVTDAIRWSVDQLAGDPEDTVDFSVESDGVIRDSILKGSEGRILTSDAFRVVPLGYDPISDSAGYPLLAFYLYGEEIHKAVLVDAFAPLLNNSDYWLSFSGLQFTHASVAVLNVWQCHDLDDPACTDRTPVENNRNALYKVAVNYYVALNIENMKEISGGLIDVVPRDKDGIPLDSLTDAVVYKSPGEPLRQWEGFLDFLDSFADTDGDGIPNISLRYATPEGRIVDVCFIATAAYGTPFEPKVQLLRDFRDKILKKCPLGPEIIDVYYTFGGSLSEPVARNEWLQALVRVLLLPVLGFVKCLLWLV